MKINKIAIELSTGCNLKCGMCPGAKSKTKKNLNFNLDQLLKLKIEETKIIKNIYFTGYFGDPLNNPICKNCIPTCGKRISHSSNYDEIINKLSK